MAVTRSKKSSTNNNNNNNVSLAHVMCDRRGTIFNYASGACVAKDTSRGRVLVAAQAKAKAALKSGKTTKEKLKTILKIGGGLGGATLAAYGAYLMAQPRFRTMLKAALTATRNKIDITGSAHRAIARVDDTVKILVGKVAALVGGAGVAIGGAAAATRRTAAHRTKKIHNGIRGIAQLVQSGASSGVSGAVKLAGGTLSAGGKVVRRTVNVLGRGVKYARNRASNVVKYARNQASSGVKAVRRGAKKVYKRLSRR